MSTISIVGAAGQTGRRVLRAMRHRGVVATAVVRSDEARRLAAEAGAGAAVFADLDEPSSLRAAFAGADAVLVIPPVLHPREDELVTNAIEAATAAGVERFVLYSVLHPYTPSLPHHMRKAASEVAVRASQLEWTILQPAMYAQTVPLYRSPHDSTVFRVPWDPSRLFSVVDLYDVAEVAALVLLEDGHHFASYELAGPEALSMSSMVQQLGNLTGARLRTVASTPDTFDAPPSWSPSAIADAVAMFTEYGEHGLLGNPTVLRGLLGREPSRFADAMRRDAAIDGR